MMAGVREGLWGLRSERVYFNGQLQPATVIVHDERIADVLNHDAAPSGVAIEDAGTRALLPGLVDSHVHVNEPGRTEWEGFETATRAAASGGITSIVDMPLNCSPVTTDSRALDTKLRALEGELHVDAGFWGGVVPGNAAELGSLADNGARGCKAFLIDSGIDEFPQVGEADLRTAMRALERAGIPLLAHAEIDLGAPPLGDPRQYSSYLASRPPEWEHAAIELLIRLARETNCPVHVVHLSSAGAVPMLREARAAGVPITVETCPHYLCLEAEEVPDGATHFKCAPPIRERENRDRLWAALEEGVIDFVVSDHSPCTPALKLPERGDFHAAWGGIASLSLGLSSVWSEAQRRNIELARVIHWLSARPAELAGLRHKGRIEPGADADLVLFDPEHQHTLESADLHFRHKLSPYLGRTLQGRVERTWLRGKLSFQAGALGPEFAAPRGRPLIERR